MTPRTRRALAAFLSLAFLSSGARAGDQVLSHVNSATPATPEMLKYQSPAWVTTTAPGALTGTIVWQSLERGPTADKLALLSLNSSRALSSQRWDGTVWGSALTLAADSGSYLTPVYAAAYEQTSEQLVVVYRKSANTSVYFREFTSASPSEQTFAMSLNAPPRWIELIPKKGSNEMLLLVSTTDRLYAAVWNGTSFGNQITVTSYLPTAGKPYAGAYSTLSGEAIVAWDDMIGQPRYRRWTGSAWTSEAYLPGSVIVRWITLASNPAANSNDIVAGILDTSYDLRAFVWNGTSWSSETMMETDAGAVAARCYDVAYDPTGSRALFAWHALNASTIRYRSYTGGAWSSQGTTASLGSKILSVYLAPGPDATGVTLAARRLGTASSGDYVLYSDSGTVSPLYSTVYGPTASNVAGVDLPASPSGSPGTSNVTVAAYATQSVAPGSYATLTVGNSSTVNFSAGNYIFSTFSGSTSDYVRLTLNTSAGDVNVIINSGGLISDDYFKLKSTGGGRACVYVRSGNVQADDYPTISNVEVYALSGAISLDYEAAVTGLLAATGNVSVYSGSVTPGANVVTPVDLLSAVIFADGVPGSPTTISTSLTSIGEGDPFALSGVTSTAPAVQITRWRETGQDE
jgi:hypothetical protein